MSQSRFQSRLSQSGSSIDLDSDTSDIELVTPVRAASFTQGSPCVGCPPLVSADCKAQLKFSPASIAAPPVLSMSLKQHTPQSTMKSYRSPGRLSTRPVTSVTTSEEGTPVSSFEARLQARHISFEHLKDPKGRVGTSEQGEDFWRFERKGFLRPSDRVDTPLKASLATYPDMEFAGLNTSGMSMKRRRTLGSIICDEGF